MLNGLLTSATDRASCCQPLLTCCAAPQGNLSAYPVVRRNESIVEDRFGNCVTDPYRVLEDLDSEETIACAYCDSVSKTTSTNPTVVEAQNNLTRDVLAECATRDQFKDLLTQLYNYPRYSTPFRRGSRCVWCCGSRVCSFMTISLPRYYYCHASDLQAQGVLYSAPDPFAEGEVFFDQNTLSSDGTVRSCVMQMCCDAFAPPGAHFRQKAHCCTDGAEHT